MTLPATQTGQMNQPQASASGITRLSAPTVRKTVRRELSVTELSHLRRVAGTLIPAGDNPGEIAADTLEGFADLAHEALAIMDPAFDSIIDALNQLALVGDDELLDALRRMDHDAPTLFYALSLLVTSIYLYSPAMEAELGYPHPHHNPAPDDMIVDEIESGLLEPVIERGSIYVEVD